MDDTLVFSETKRGPSYNRESSTEQINLSNILKKRYNAKYCYVTPSGMSAISTVLTSIIELIQVEHILYSNELFVLTPKLILRLSKIYGINCSTFDIDKNLIKDENLIPLREKSIILFAESCSNPNGYFFNFSIIPELKKHYPKMIIVIDNTWLSSAIFNPFMYNVDHVVVSLTKYYSAGTAIAGAILTNEILNNISRIISLNGLHVSPHNCTKIMEAMKDLDERLLRSSELTLMVLEKLKNNDKIFNLAHPYLQNEQKYISIFPPVFTFVVNVKKYKVLQVLKKSSIEYKTSFGGPFTRTDLPSKAGLHPLSSINMKLQKTADGCSLDEENIAIRISIGYDDNYSNCINNLSSLIDHLYL
jgi:cystathionine beta-lyase/cystathionine gamma-synthase